MIDLGRIVEMLRGHDSYELKGRVIHRRQYLREETLALDEIESWAVHPEMSFDVVEIRRKGGGTLVWFDHKDDLKAILDASGPPGSR